MRTSKTILCLRYGSATYKAPVATVLDPNGKLSITLSYGKLLSRSLKIAYNLLNKIGLNNKAGECQVSCDWSRHQLVLNSDWSRSSPGTE